MLVCNDGMSTSYLAAKMQEIATARGLKVQIWAGPEHEIEEKQDTCDVILLGPQIGYMESSIRKWTGDKPLMTIAPIDYGRLNAEKVLDDALKLLEGRE